MTTTLEKYYKGLSDKALKMVCDDLMTSYKESVMQWEDYCEDCKKGFAKESDWEREGLEQEADKRRQYFFMKKEIDFRSWSDFSDFLRTKGKFFKEMY